MKNIKGILRRFIALVKLCFIKLFHYKYFDFCLMEIVSPSTRFLFADSGAISLRKNIGTRNNVEFSVRAQGKIFVGESCFFNNNCMIVSHEKIEIGNNCSFGPNVLMYDHDHDFKVSKDLKENEFKSSPIIIGDNVWIGANSVILRGTKIGSNTVIGAGSILKGEYPANSVVITDRTTKIKKYS